MVFEWSRFCPCRFGVFCSYLDIRQWYHQIRLTADSCAKTAFSTPDGHYEYTSQTFEVKDAPSYTQRVINQVLSDFIDRVGFVNIDDITVVGTT